MTESVLLDEGEQTLATLTALRALGIRPAIDDFGTGYSALSYLRRFPFDVLKIGKSFVDGIDANRQNRAVASAIVTLGQTLGLDLVAEGIETPG